MKLKLIETYLPLEALARAAANETRAGVGAPSSLHLWWGNRQVTIESGWSAVGGDCRESVGATADGT